VFLPPNQRRSGTVEVYNLNYNIAIISVAKGFFRTCLEYIFKTNPSSEKAYLQLISNEHLKSSQKVIAVGRDACEGLLMGTIGEVKPTNEDSKLNCEELRLSTCEINKVLWSTSLAVFVHGSYSSIRFLVILFNHTFAL